MEKMLKPKENYNPEKLCKEIKAEGVENRIWYLEDAYKLEWDQEGVDTKIEAVLSVHNPILEPRPLTETELLKEQVTMLDGALNELLFEIIPNMGGEI